MIAIAFVACSRKSDVATTAMAPPTARAGTESVSPAPTPEPIRVLPSADLAGTQWTVVRLRGKPLLAGSHVSLEITRDRMGGYDGCNWYGIAFKDLPTANPRSFQLLGGIESSARGCESDAHLRQSQQYFVALRAALELHRQGNRLRALDIEQVPLLEFELQQRVAMDPTQLVGSSWRLRGTNGESRAHAEGQAITLRFAEGTLRGHAGCRDYTGTYHAENDQLAVPSLAMATLECADATALRREGEFTSRLSETHRYRLDENALTLFTSTGHRLEFVACERCAK